MAYPEWRLRLNSIPDLDCCQTQLDLKRSLKLCDHLVGTYASGNPSPPLHIEAEFQCYLAAVEIEYLSLRGNYIYGTLSEEVFHATMSVGVMKYASSVQELQKISELLSTARPSKCVSLATVMLLFCTFETYNKKTETFAPEGYGQALIPLKQTLLQLRSSSAQFNAELREYKSQLSLENMIEMTEFFQAYSYLAEDRHKVARPATISALNDYFNYKKISEKGAWYAWGKSLLISSLLHDVRGIDTRLMYTIHDDERYYDIAISSPPLDPFRAAVCGLTRASNKVQSGNWVYTEVEELVAESKGCLAEFKKWMPRYLLQAATMLSLKIADNAMQAARQKYPNAYRDVRLEEYSTLMGADVVEMDEWTAEVGKSRDAADWGEGGTL